MIENIPSKEYNNRCVVGSMMDFLTASEAAGKGPNFTMECMKVL